VNRDRRGEALGSVGFSFSGGQYRVSGHGHRYRVGRGFQTPIELLWGSTAVLGTVHTIDFLYPYEYD
jgi:hypothetical protein